MPNPHWAEPPPVPGARCADCVWQHGPPGELRCRRHGDASVQAETAACPAWQPELDCLRCGACCREAYDVVEIDPKDPFCEAHPELLEQVGPHLQLRREEGRCVALCPDSYACAVYTSRPQLCRDFEHGSDNCLFARRRVGLTA